MRVSNQFSAANLDSLRDQQGAHGVDAVSTRDPLIALASNGFAPITTQGKPTYIGIPPYRNIAWEYGIKDGRTNVLKGPGGTLYEIPVTALYGGRDSIRAWAVRQFNAGQMRDHYGASEAPAAPPKARVGYKTFEAGLYGGRVQATPSVPDGRGKALWTITARAQDGRTATALVYLSRQFGLRDLIPGSPAKCLLDLSLRTAITHGLNPIPASQNKQVQQPVSDGLAQPLSWIYERLSIKQQHVYPLWNGPNDYMVRVVMDQRATAKQPANITLKTTISGVSLNRAKQAALKSLNFTVRHESSSIKTSVGTKLQFGYDVSREGAYKRREYTAVGEPIMDLISIEAIGDLTLDRLRGELKLEVGEKPQLEAVMQNALSMGGNIRWRRVWEHASTGGLSGIDVVLSMKAEGAIEAGYNNARGGLEKKAEIEASVRFIGGIASQADIHALQKSASQSIAQMLIPIPQHPVMIDPTNRGTGALARRKVTTHLAFGASVWQMAPDQISGGRNHGHLALDLAIRVNHLLHQTGQLNRDSWIRSNQEAAQKLQTLWKMSSPEQRRRYAQSLCNPLGINFGLKQLEQANAQRFDDLARSPYHLAHRKLFLSTFAAH